MKKCPKCLNLKKFEDYHRTIAHIDGLSSICKSCKSAYDKFRALKNKIRHIKPDDFTLSESEIDCFNKFHGDFSKGYAGQIQ